MMPAGDVTPRELSCLHADDEKLDKNALSEAASNISLSEIILQGTKIQCSNSKVEESIKNQGFLSY